LVVTALRAYAHPTLATSYGLYGFTGAFSNCGRKVNWFLSLAIS
jgi:hypothetical protein